MNIQSLLIALAFLVLGNTVFAQSNNKHYRMTARLEKVITLSADQKAQIHKLEDEIKEKLKATNDKKKTKRELRNEFKERATNILTPEQINQLKAAKEKRKERKAELKEMRKELKDHRSSSVKPKIKALRQKFDNVLSTEEKATIASIRNNIKAKKKASKSPNSEEKFNKGRRENKVGRRYFKQHPEELEKLEAIAEKHQNELAQIKTEIRQYEEEWQNETQQIKAKHLTAEELEKQKKRLEKRKNRRAKKSKDKGHKKGDIIFLLMQP